MSKKILVTGGAGFIGSHLVDALVEEGHEVRILDNLEPQVHGNKIPDYLNHEAEFIRGDIRDEYMLRKALKNIEVVFHQAAIVGVGQSMYHINQYMDINTQGTAKLLDVIVNDNYDIEKLVVASSMSIYGEGEYVCEEHNTVYPDVRTRSQLEARDWDVKCPECGKKVKPQYTGENKPLHPTSIYAISKRDQEEMCLVIGRAYGIPTVALRYFNGYGPRQALSNPYTGVCAIFSSRIKNGKPPLIYEDGLQKRDFISVHDIVTANLLAMRKKEADYEVFNVGTGEPITISGVADILIKLYEKDFQPEVISKYRAGDIRHCYADISKIKSILGFEPEYSLTDGMRELYQWGDRAFGEDNSQKVQEELKIKSLLT